MVFTLTTSSPISSEPLSQHACPALEEDGILTCCPGHTSLFKGVPCVKASMTSIKDRLPLPGCLLFGRDGGREAIQDAAPQKGSGVTAEQEAGRSPTSSACIPSCSPLPPAPCPQPSECPESTPQLLLQGSGTKGHSGSMHRNDQPQPLLTQCFL